MSCAPAITERQAFQASNGGPKCRPIPAFLRHPELPAFQLAAETRLDRPLERPAFQSRGELGFER